MGFRDSIRKKGGGGFLKGDATLVSYEFTRRAPGADKDGTYIHWVPSFLMDGSENPVSRHMFLGGEDYTISEDGQEVTSDSDSVRVGATAGRFLETLLEASDKAGADIESELPDLSAGEPLNLSGLVGKRFRLGSEIDEQAEKKAGLKPRFKDGKKVLDPKTGKQIMDRRTITVVEAVLGTSNGNGNGNGHKAIAAGKKGIKVDISDEAEAILKDIVENQEVSIKNLALFVAKKLLKLSTTDKPKAEALKAKMLNTEFHEGLDWLNKDKKGMLSVSE